MRKQKMAVALTAMVAVAGLALTGCGGGRDGGNSGGGSGDAAKGFEAGSAIGVSLPQKTSENWVLAEKLFNDDLKSAGFKPDVQFANGGASEQQNQITSMITNGVKVLIVGAVDGGQLGSQLQQAKDAGITVIAYDRLLTNTDNVDYYLAYDNYKVGELQGQALLDGLKARKGDKKPYNIELIAGSPDDANSKVFFDGAMSVLKPAIEKGELAVGSGQTSFDQVATQGWKAENVQKRMDSVLSGTYSGGKVLDGILSPNDTLARAAILSAKQAGQDTPVVTGQDSEVESVKSIMAGEQYSTINKDTTALVKRAVEITKSLQEGKAIETTATSDNGQKKVPTVFLEPKLVTKENAKESYANDKMLSEIVNAG